MRISDWSSDVCSSDLGDFNFERLQWAEVALGQDDLDSVRPRAARAQRDVRHGALLVDVEVGLGRGGCGQEARRRRQTEAGGQANDDERDRADKRRAGHKCVSTWRSRWVPSHITTKLK